MIEYCLSNVDKGARRRLRAHEDAVEAPCLEHCGICRRKSFLVVDGEFVSGEGTCTDDLLTTSANAAGESG